ncbi:MAG TPA: GvpL/GvpF family gas vesicle protein [Pyrinomonadaceae bacterium]
MNGDSRFTTMLYAYCVTRTKTESPRNLTGLFDREVFSITAGDLSAFASQLSDEPVVVSKHSVLTHQKVVGSLLEAATPLPFRFGTVVTQADLTSYLVSRRKSLLEKLAAVDGCVEMSVKIIWQQPPVDDQPELQTAQPSLAGTEFLRRKSAELSGSQQLIHVADNLAAWLKLLLEPSVSQIHLTVRPTQRLVLSADCLVPRVQLQRYQSTVEAARSERPDLHFLTSGPWAPYSFANIELEFKSQFGVS